MRKIRMGIREKEYQLKCCGLYYSEGVKEVQKSSKTDLSMFVPT